VSNTKDNKCQQKVIGEVKGDGVVDNNEKLSATPSSCRILGFLLWWITRCHGNYSRSMLHIYSWQWYDFAI